MTIRLILLLSLGTLGYGSVLLPGYAAGSLYSGYGGDYAGKYHNYKSYAFEYGVSDPHTGDHKAQWETKDKDGTVRGSYSLLEPDGTTRIVDYVADEHGFRAVVKKVGLHGTTVETHGSPEHEEVAANLPIEAPIEPVAYKSYDGGYEDYSDLKPIVADVYAKPVEYVQAPKAEFVVNVPEAQLSSFAEVPLYPKAEGLKVSLPEQYWAPEEKYALPEKNYVFPEEKYILPEEKYVLHDEYQNIRPEYLLNDYKVAQEYQTPIEYKVPSHNYISAPAYSYVQENRYNTPKGKAIIVQSPETIQQLPKQDYWAPLSLSGPAYNLNLAY